MFIKVQQLLLDIYIFACAVVKDISTLPELWSKQAHQSFSCSKSENYHGKILFLCCLLFRYISCLHLNVTKLQVLLWEVLHNNLENIHPDCKEFITYSKSISSDLGLHEGRWKRKIICTFASCFWTVRHHFTYVEIFESWYSHQVGTLSTICHW